MRVDAKTRLDPRDLRKLWEAPDNTRLSKRQMAFRLPLHVVAKIEAVSKLYPKKSKTELVGDLLAAALDQFAEGLPTEIERGEEDMEHGGFTGRRGLYETFVDYELSRLEKEEAEEGQPAQGQRAPLAGSASAEPTKTARPAAGGRGDHRSRKRTPAGGRRAR
jgi:hypothetical protein